MNGGNLRDDLLQGVQQDAGGVQRGEHIHAVLYGAPADGNAVLLMHPGLERLGVEDVADEARLDGGENHH